MYSTCVYVVHVYVIYVYVGYVYVVHVYMYNPELAHVDLDLRFCIDDTDFFFKSFS